MRRSTSRIGKLPPDLLEEVNQKLYEGWGYPLVRKWLFEQVAEEDVPALGLAKGEAFSLVWLRAAKTPGNAGHFCELALGNWFRAWHPKWVKEKLRRGDSMRLVRQAKELTQEAYAEGFGGEGQVGTRRQSAAATTDGDEAISIEGGNVMMRSVLIDAISTIRGGSNDPKDIAQLANAWARLNQGHVEEAKLQLKTEDARQAAFDQLGKEIKGDPEALELFKKLRGVMESRNAAG